VNEARVLSGLAVLCAGLYAFTQAESFLERTIGPWQRKLGDAMNYHVLLYCYRVAAAVVLAVGLLLIVW
jgi:hypothetical protein